MLPQNSVSFIPRLVDSTLREGVQAAGVRFGTAETFEIAGILASAGVDIIECGHPAIGEQESERVRAAISAASNVPVLAHARARLEDVDKVAETGAQWVGIFAGVNEISRAVRIGLHRSVQSLIRSSVSRARLHGLKVRFTVEDGSRTSWEELIEGFRCALDGGADRICYADTVGLLLPWETEEIITRLVAEFQGVDLEVHFHDDRGMANANALAAVRAGAKWVSCSVNGIGERCGITDTLLLIANMDALGWRSGANGTLLQRLSGVVQAHSRLVPDRWRPIVGKSAFTHVARLHRRAVDVDERAYAWLPAQRLGRITSTSPRLLPKSHADLINSPEVISATELRHHRHGPGDRYLMIDERVVTDARQYCIVRRVPTLSNYGRGHVDTHRHTVDSLFLFLGDGERLAGLTVEVRLGEEIFLVESPASVFIPSGVVHSYRVIGGQGLFVNHVLAGDYNSSLLDFTASTDTSRTKEPPQAESHILVQLREFIKSHMPIVKIDAETRILDVVDSLLFLDLFLHIEKIFGSSISLDDISACDTFGEMANLLENAEPGKAKAKVDNECRDHPSNKLPS
jgi:2-isopropylmalate synthase